MSREPLATIGRSDLPESFESAQLRWNGPIDRHWLRFDGPARLREIDGTDCCFLCLNPGLCFGESFMKQLRPFRLTPNRNNSKIAYEIADPRKSRIQSQIGIRSDEEGCQ